MPRYDDRHGTTRLYVGHLSSRTRSRDLEDVFSRYGRFPGFTWRFVVRGYPGGIGRNYCRVVRDVDMKRDFAFVEFSDSRDADDARYSLNGRDVDGSRIVVEFAKGAPRGPGGSREFLGKGPAPGSGRCFNCGIDGHWARDCKAGDWKNKCYRCGDRGHIEKNCQNSPKKLKRARSYSRTPSPGHGRSRSPSYSRDRSYSRSRSPPKERSIERAERRSRSPRRRRSSPPPRGRKHSPSPDEQSPQGRATPSPGNSKQGNGSDYHRRSKARSRSPIDDAHKQSPRHRSPEENGHRPSLSPRDDMSPVDENRGFPRNSDSG